MHLDGSTCSECLPERTRHFQSPEHVPRTSRRTQISVWSLDGLPVRHGAESTKKNPWPEERKMPKGEKIIFLYVYKVPLRNVC